MINWTTDWYDNDISVCRNLSHYDRYFAVTIDPIDGSWEVFITEVSKEVAVKRTYISHCDNKQEAEALVEEYLEEYIKPNARFRIIDCDTKKTTREFIKKFDDYTEVPNCTGGDEDFIVMDTFRKEYIWCENGFAPFCSLYELNNCDDSLSLEELENNRY